MDTSTLGLGERGARQVHHTVVVVIMPHCLAATGVDTFCPGTVWATCVWRLFVVTVLACLRAFQRVFVHAYAYSKTHNHMTMCAYTEPRDTRRTTAGQPRDNPRDHHGTTRGTASGTTVGQPTGQPRDNPRDSPGALPPPPSPFEGAEAELVELVIELV